MFPLEISLGWVWNLHKHSSNLSSPDFEVKTLHMDNKLKDYYQGTTFQAASNLMAKASVII